MPIEVERYLPEKVPLVMEFNQRLKVGGATMQFPEYSQSLELPPSSDYPDLYQEYFLAVENASVVRGAYILKHQDFWLKSKTLRIADFQLPISEGIVNSGYNLVGLQVVLHALKIQPYLYALGMGGTEAVLPRLLKGMCWKVESVPFFFKVLSGKNFALEMKFLRRDLKKRILLNMAAYLLKVYSLIAFGKQFVLHF
jgi:hypothetical protein